MFKSRALYLLIIISFAACTPLSDTLNRTGVKQMINKPEIHLQQHSPINPSAFSPVTFTAQLEDSVGIKNISLEIFEYELFINDLSQPSKRQKENGIWGEVKTWNILNSPKTKEVSYTDTNGFANSSNVVYQFTVWNILGEKQIQRVQFDAGPSPWPQDKILLYGDENSDLSQSINICFIADIDFHEDWDHFTKEIESLIYNGYLQNNMIESNQKKWKFFYSKRSLDGRQLYQNYLDQEQYPDYLTSGSIDGIDAFGLIHQTEYSDASYLKSNLSFISFNLFTSESFNYGTAVHETGHAVFNLYDEYNGCTCTRGQGGANVFSSQEDCQNYLIINGLKLYECPELENYKGELFYAGEENIYFESQDSCEAYTEKNNLDKPCIRYRRASGELLYRAEGAICIMQDDGNNLVNDFQQVCASIINTYYDNLGDVFASQIESQVNNMYNYVPVVISEFTQDSSAMEFNLNNIRYGIPSKTATGNAYMSFQFQDQDGNKISNLAINNPAQINLHQDGLVKTVALKNSSTTIKIPVLKNMAKISCSMLQKDPNQRNSGLEPIFEVGEKLNELQKLFQKGKN